MVSFHQLPFLDALHLFQPGIGQQLADRQPDAFLVLINADYLYLHFLPDFEHFVRVLDMFPTDLGQVNQSISAIDIDERPKLCQAGNTTFTGSARFQFIEQSFFEGFTRLLQRRTLRQDQTMALAVDFDHFHLNRTANHLGPLLIGRGFATSITAAKNADLRGRYEATQAADGYDQATFVIADDLGIESLA